jgi:hypothetical protein
MEEIRIECLHLADRDLLRFKAHELIQHEGTIALMKGLHAEMVAVAKLQGINIDDAERWKAITKPLEKPLGRTPPCCRMWRQIGKP